MVITHVLDTVTENCLNQFNFLRNSSDFQKKIKSPYNPALTTEIWWSDDLLPLLEELDKTFIQSLTYLRNVAEKIFHKRLEYNYIHFLDYYNGGTMTYHSHNLAEDYVFILYLNDCFDGETNFYFKEVVSLVPKKSQVAYFESHVEHSGSFTKDKKILVGGLKKYIDI